jgi:prepilin-type processing-associated H-X9-DG protein
MILDGSGGQWPRSHAPQLQLLPYLEQEPVYSQIDLLLAAERFVLTQDVNDGPKRAQVPLFVCPSDAGAFAGRLNNYRANIGVTAFPHDPNVPRDPPLEGDGAFCPTNRFLAPQHFRDGLSNTVGFSEKLGGSGDSQRFWPARDYFYVDVPLTNSIWNSPDSEAMQVEACAAVTNPEVYHDQTAGMYWFYGGFADTWYNHVLTPNHAIPDCGYGSGMWLTGVMTARSLHPGGVNCLMMDGSLRFVANGIDRAVWQAAATRNGGHAAFLE